ncbi:MAG TPA: hypothetical protein VM840_13655 [Actinomycetota bacterium]|nr:hypothetical protein [Actinomycetota bacterium]
MYLDKEQIRQAQDIPSEDSDVPEWGGRVRVCGLTGKQRDDYEASIVRFRGDRRVLDLRNVRARLVVLCVVDADGRRVFADTDVSWLTETF